MTVVRNQLDAVRLFAREPSLLLKFWEWLGRAPHPSANGQAILKISNPRLPQFHFEWHPQTRRVYLLRDKGLATAEGVPMLSGEVMAFNIETHGDAANAVNIWSRGYDEGRDPNTPKLNLQL